MIKSIKGGFSYAGPLRGSRDADVAHGENEFDPPDLEGLEGPLDLGRIQSVFYNLITK